MGLPEKCDWGGGGGKSLSTHKIISFLKPVYGFKVSFLSLFIFYGMNLMSWQLLYCVLLGHHVLYDCIYI